MYLEALDGSDSLVPVVHHIFCVDYVPSKSVQVIVTLCINGLQNTLNKVSIVWRSYSTSK